MLVHTICFQPSHGSKIWHLEAGFTSPSVLPLRVQTYELLLHFPNAPYQSSDLSKRLQSLASEGTD